MPQEQPALGGALLAWVEQVVRDRYGTWAEFAKAIGKSQGAVKRTLRAGYGKVETILMVAKATGTAPSELLLRAGKVDAHRLITELYGEERAPLSPELQDVVRALQLDAPALVEWQRSTIAAARVMLQLSRIQTPIEPPAAAMKPAGPDKPARRGTPKRKG